MRLIDADKLFSFLTEQLEKEKGMYTKCCNDGINIARSALHDETITPTIKTPPNDPLTLEELREMDGEPVWIEFIHTPMKSEYRIIRALSDYAIIFQEYDKNFGPYKSLFLGHCGKCWMAYRRKPEEV